jgi:hypothetical protein
MHPASCGDGDQEPFRSARGEPRRSGRGTPVCFDARHQFDSGRVGRAGAPGGGQFLSHPSLYLKATEFHPASRTDICHPHDERLLSLRFPAAIGLCTQMKAVGRIWEDSAEHDTKRCESMAVADPANFQFCYRMGKSGKPCNSLPRTAKPPFVASIPTGASERLLAIGDRLLAVFDKGPPTGRPSHFRYSP